MCDCHLQEGEENLYIRAEVFAGEESAIVEVKTKHNHISRIEKNGKILFSQDDLEAGSQGDKSKLNLKDIYEFANTVELEDVKPLMQRQLDYNEAIAKEGLANPWGSMVGQTLLEVNGDSDWRIKAKAMAAAGSDARMSGCALPVVINSGSGNQGITVSMPILVYAKKVGCSEEKMLRVLKMNTDDRGSFTEIMKSENCGQFSVNVSKPGITKGRHWHNTKWEIFIVVSGKGLIRERKIGTDEVLEFEGDGEHQQAVLMLPGYTHEIINLSTSQNLVTIIWANEKFDPQKPDTYFEEV